MALDVTRLELGPIGTNCYLVRNPGSPRNGGRRPGRGRGRDPARTGPPRRALRRDPRHARPLGPPGRRRGPGGGNRRARAHGRGRARAAGARERLHAAWRHVPAVHAGGPSRGRRDARARRDHVRDGPRARPLAGAPRLRGGRSALLRRRSLRRLGRPRRTCPAPTGTSCSASIRSLADRFPPETTVFPGHGPATTLGAEVATNPFLAELRAS